MTAQERADRNASIFEARIRGFGWTEIALEHGVSKRQAQRIHADVCQASPKQRVRRDPEEAVEELLAGYDAAIADYAALARDSKHDGTRLGALRGRIEMQVAKFEAMMATGVLPSSLGQVAAVIDGRQTAEKIIAVFDRHGVSMEAKREVRLALDPASADARQGLELVSA